MRLSTAFDLIVTRGRTLRSDVTHSAMVRTVEKGLASLTRGCRVSRDRLRRALAKRQESGFSREQIRVHAGIPNSALREHVDAITVSHERQADALMTIIVFFPLSPPTTSTMAASVPGSKFAVASSITRTSGSVVERSGNTEALTLAPREAAAAFTDDRAQLARLACARDDRPAPPAALATLARRRSLPSCTPKATLLVKRRDRPRSGRRFGRHIRRFAASQQRCRVNCVHPPGPFLNSEPAIPA